MKWFKTLGNMVIPAILFYIVYHIVGIIPSVFISSVYSLISIVYSKVKNGAIKNSQIIGILGLVGSAVAILFTGEEKLYYIPALVENMIFLGFIIVLSARHKSILHYMAKDFEIASLEQIPEESMFGINVVWIIYFVLKVISKIAGILYFDFNTLYWVVFLLGDPMLILVVVLSIILIRISYSKASIFNPRNHKENNSK